MKKANTSALGAFYWLAAVSRRPATRLALAACLALGAAAPLGAAPAPAPTQPRPVAPLPGPRQAQAVRQPTARLRTLRADRDLTYLEDAEPETEGILLRLLRWVFGLIARLRSTQGGRLTWNLVFYGLAIGLLVFAVLKFLQLDVARLFGRSSRAQKLGYEVGSENIHELDFKDAIAQAEAAGNLRLAVRLGYLHLLKQLTDQGLIDWQPDKTNQAYLRELAAARPTLRPPFTELTRQFEYVWYGEFPLTGATYRPLRDGQQHLSQQLAVAA